MPFFSLQRTISKITRISKQRNRHLSDRRAVLSSHKVEGGGEKKEKEVTLTLDSTLELATVLILTVDKALD